MQSSMDAMKKDLDEAKAKLGDAEKKAAEVRSGRRACARSQRPPPRGGGGATSSEAARRRRCRKRRRWTPTSRWAAKENPIAAPPSRRGRFLGLFCRRQDPPAALLALWHSVWLGERGWPDLLTEDALFYT